jgi:hypothetical protein
MTSFVFSGVWLENKWVSWQAGLDGMLDNGAISRFNEANSSSLFSFKTKLSSIMHTPVKDFRAMSATNTVLMSACKTT